MTKTKETSTDQSGRSCIAKLIVCEDDPATLQLLSGHLEADRYEVLMAPTAADALRLCEHNRPDLLLLDLNLPDESGIEVLKMIKDKELNQDRFDPDLAAIVLSGRGTERCRVRALELGADDYIVKPFSYSELLARISAVLRKRKSGEPETIVVEKITINKADKSVTVDGRPVRLSPKEFALLCYLAEKPHEIRSKEDALRAVWGYRSIGHTRTLDAHASSLSRKLDPDTGKYVKNCWGVAWSLLGPDAVGGQS